MTNDNPWDDLNNDNPNKERSSIEESSVEDLLFFGKEKQKNKDNFFKKRNKNTQSRNDCSNAGDDNDEGFLSGFCDFLSNKIPFKSKGNLQLFICFVFAVLFFWVLSGFYTIHQEESAIVMRFGRYNHSVDAGLHYHLPYPIETVVKEATTRVRVLKIGGDNYASNRGDKVLGEGWALTGDENIVNLELNVQWKIGDLKKFVFKVRDKQQTIYDATQSAVREVISKRKLASILTSERGEIEEETKKILQEMLNSYDMGVDILVVQMLKIDPPSQVLNSFRDVQTARVDKESEINVAYKYKNDLLPKVRGEAGKIIEDANGYAISVVNRAKGDANRFNQIFNQYKNAPFVTRKNMYLNTIGELFSKNKVTIVDENVKNIFLDNKSNDNDTSSLRKIEKEGIVAAQNEEDNK